MDQFVVVVVPDGPEPDQYTPEEALATLAEMPPGIGFGTIVEQDDGGLGLAVIATAPKPLEAAYIMLAHDVHPEDDDVPQVDIYIGYENFGEFAAHVLRAPYHFEGDTPWVRMDTLATVWLIGLMQEMAAGEEETVGF